MVRKKIETIGNHNYTAWAKSTSEHLDYQIELKEKKNPLHCKTLAEVKGISV